MYHVNVEMFRRFIDICRPRRGSWGQGRLAGASSFHLIWEMPGTAGSSSCAPGCEPRLVEVCAVLEVIVPPRDPALYFWALQVDLADERGVWGGAHTGLQWNARYPQARAINWGGYSCGSEGRVLSGTMSALPGFSDDLNTVCYPWSVGCPYRLRIYPSPEHRGAWRAEITDLSTDATTQIRDLFPPPGRGLNGSWMQRPMVWTEVFARCSAPSVTARWSRFEAKDERGAQIHPVAVLVNYQSATQGGCPNTTVLEERQGVYLQVTNTPRVVPQGTRLLMPVSP